MSFWQLISCHELVFFIKMMHHEFIVYFICYLTIEVYILGGHREQI